MNGNTKESNTNKVETLKEGKQKELTKLGMLPRVNEGKHQQEEKKEDDGDSL